jgi:hypothetical protein
LRQLITAREKATAKPDALVLKQENQKLIEELYLRILSRFPTAPEAEIAEAYLTSPKRNVTDSVFDLAWDKMNSKEFILKH